MSVDLTGINNVNDFFTSHYLATYFDENVKEAAAAWKELEESRGIKSPASGLRAVANQSISGCCLNTNLRQARSSRCAMFPRWRAVSF